MLRTLLRFQHQLGRQKTVRLRHRRLGPIEDIVDNLVAVGQVLVGGVDVLGLFLVYEEQVAAAGPSRDINVLSNFNKAVCTQDGQAPVAPG